MYKMLRVTSLVVILALLSSCSFATTSATHTPVPTAVLLPSATALSTSTAIVISTATAPAAAAATATTAPSATSLPIPTNTAVPTSQPAPTSTTQPTGGGSMPDYLDDRSTASGLVLSLFNAINRKEYLRAYAYWEDPTHNKNTGPYDQYVQGYQNTDSVQVTLGDQMISGAGAGQRYYSVPVVLKATTTGGQLQTFAGCYTLHLSSPDIQTAPPFQPMSIQSADVKSAANNADLNALLAAACPANGEPLVPMPTTDPSTIAASNYLDDRSTAVDVLSSLFNAINRKEYSRAYAYWAAGLAQPFAQFQQGYQNTASVAVSFGTVTSDVGAGQIRYRVPAALTSQTTDGKTQYFAGCYQLHLAQPAIQGALPFLPLAIERAQVVTASSAADAANKMITACTNMP